MCQQLQVLSEGTTTTIEYLRSKRKVVKDRKGNKSAIQFQTRNKRLNKSSPSIQ
jgi:hypothetical protein